MNEAPRVATVTNRKSTTRLHMSIMGIFIHQRAGQVPMDFGCHGEKIMLIIISTKSNDLLENHGQDITSTQNVFNSGGNFWKPIEWR